MNTDLETLPHNLETALQALVQRHSADLVHQLRPILLTALAIILGSAIMITDPVFGGLAVSLIFGTFASTALTLVVIPLLYYIWQKRSAPAA